MTIQLDAAQQGVVDHDSGPLLVLGGPGTGKTLVVEERYLRLAEREGLAPHQILILCVSRQYSLKAKDRLIRKLPQKATIEIPVYTWHALAYHLVARYFPKLGFADSPILLTAPEQWGVVRHLMSKDAASDWPHWTDRLGEKAFVDEVADFCLRVQQLRKSDEEVSAYATGRDNWAEVVAFYRRYKTYLREQDRIDYPGLINAASELLETDEEVRATLHRRFPHVLVDDAQEMSRAQQHLVSLLDTENLVATADPDSGIESFTGAEPDWVSGFTARFGGDTTVLSRTYRLGKDFLDKASQFIKENDLVATHRATEGAGAPTEHEARHYSSLAEEAEAVASELRTLYLQSKVPWSEMAVLVSQPSRLMGPLEDALTRKEVPFQSSRGNKSLSSEPVVAAFLDLVRVALRIEGWESLVPGLLTSLLGRLSFAERRTLERRAWGKNRTLLQEVENAPEAGEYRRLLGLAEKNLERIDECFWEVYNASLTLEEFREASTDPVANKALDALVSFSHSLSRFVERRHGTGSAEEYLSEAARAEFGAESWPSGSSNGTKGVTLTTFHSSRGREWDVVCVAGCLDQWIPKGRRAQGLFDPFSLETPSLSEREVEAIAEDRRTFYVAATRARKKVLFTVAPGVSGKGVPSRFLTELFGEPPPKTALLADSPPLTFREMRAHLRRILESSEASPGEKVAAAIALAKTPGTDPSRWYGRRAWTKGTVPLVEDELVTSYSRISTYDECGLQYLLQSVLGLDATSTHSMKFGSWMHKLFEGLGKGDIQLDKLEAKYEEFFDDSVFPSPAVARNYRRYGERILDNFVQNEMRHMPAEVEFKFEDLRIGRARFRGMIDRIDKRGKNLTLTDYKTSRSSVGREEAEESLQLAIYMKVAETDPELTKLGTPVTARLVYPGQTWASGDMVLRCQSPEQAKEVVEKKLPQIIDDVIAEKFSPSPEANCRWCAMKPLCPIWYGKDIS